MEPTITNEQVRYMADRRTRQRVVLMAVPALIGLLLALWTLGIGDDFFFRKSILPKELYLTLALSLLGLSGIVVVMTYLQTGFRRSEAIEFEVLRSELVEQRGELQARAELGELAIQVRTELAQLRLEAESRTPKAEDFLDAEQRRAFVTEIKSQLTAEAAEALYSDLKLRITTSWTNETKNTEALRRFDESRTRLTRELEALTRRGNLNLALGAVTTIVGLGLLGVSVFSEVTESREIWSFASHFLPRLTLVLMIELFAYFFLSLYKSSLAEIKYFQNELTNLESKQVALSAAISHGDPAVVSDILSKIATTERNHILTKDQTTVELEKARIDKDGKSDIAKYLAELLPKKA